MFMLLAMIGGLLPGPVPLAPAVRSMNALRTQTGVVLTLELTGPATPSAPRLLENPLRLYFDLPGVTPGQQRALTVAAGSVSHVRIGMNQPAPPVTRVVIELSGKVRWRLEPGATPAEVRVVMDERDPGKAPPTGARGTVVYGAPHAAVLPARDRRTEITGGLLDMAPAVEAMRAWQGPSDAELAALIGRAEGLAAGARAMQITGSASDVALVAAIDAVLAAARSRGQALADGTPQSRANAIAAAAGAGLLLEHARAVAAR